jgi:hypothetical protein
LQSLLSETNKQSTQSSANDSSFSNPSTSKTTRKLAFHPAPPVSFKPDEDDKFERDPRLLDTSMLSHSIHANGLFEKLNSGFPTVQSSRLKRAITTLQTTLKSQSGPETAHDLEFTENRQGATDPKVSELEVPPVEAVLDLLHSGNGKYQDWLLAMDILIRP